LDIFFGVDPTREKEPFSQQDLSATARSAVHDCFEPLAYDTKSHCNTVMRLALKRREISYL